MKIILHYPENEEALSALSQRVADIHSEAVCGCLKTLACPREQKRKLVDAMQRAAGGKSGPPAKPGA